MLTHILRNCFTDPTLIKTEQVFSEWAECTPVISPTGKDFKRHFLLDSICSMTILQNIEKLILKLILDKVFI